MKLSNWHTSGRTNKTKDVDAEFWTASHLPCSLLPIRLAIRTKEAHKVKTAGKHKSEIKFCDICMSVKEAEELIVYATKAINYFKQWEAAIKKGGPEI